MFFLSTTTNLRSATYYLTSAGALNAQLPASWNTNANGNGTPLAASGNSSGFVKYRKFKTIRNKVESK